MISRVSSNDRISAGYTGPFPILPRMGETFAAYRARSVEFSVDGGVVPAWDGVFDDPDRAEHKVPHRLLAKAQIDGAIRRPGDQVMVYPSEAGVHMEQIVPPSDDEPEFIPTVLPSIVPPVPPEPVNRVSSAPPMADAPLLHSAPTEDEPTETEAPPPETAPAPFIQPFSSPAPEPIAPAHEGHPEGS